MPSATADRRHPSPSPTENGMSSAPDPRPELVCLDLEGVLVPEIWINVAERTGIEALRRTTRDEPDYDVLMRYRLDVLDRHGLRLSDIQDVIATMAPLPGAIEFLGWARERFGVVILSDTFAEFARPLMRQLGWPTLFCHSLMVDGDGRITGYRLRLPDQKRAAVRAFGDLGFRIIAAGDSHNDTAMLLAADAGILFDPPQSVVDAFGQLPVTRGYDELRAAISAASTRRAGSGCDDEPRA
ncbi:bifunctional phosphoserine phosphatase/homoserine phosphotransferase ThrH [Propionicicella superfundia]|uniref:bifunctional phosphoserine phosphatase/homoserine phosphotransferase ThrH n=1 Tax=Propionicicella superfundia TaxID=348582 RepID=UPI0004205E44|nr:bifunctional phosphoserine phosphatase/homoserine phosphotransferase ThrH [Propionicicella superfundia]